MAVPFCRILAISVNAENLHEYDPERDTKQGLIVLQAPTPTTISISVSNVSPAIVAWSEWLEAQ